MSSISAKENNQTPNNNIPVEDLVYSYDWSTTSLGPMSSWGPVLKSTVVCKEYYY